MSRRTAFPARVKQPLKRPDFEPSRIARVATEICRFANGSCPCAEKRSNSRCERLLSVSQFVVTIARADA